MVAAILGVDFSHPPDPLSGLHPCSHVQWSVASVIRTVSFLELRLIVDHIEVAFSHSDHGTSLSPLAEGMFTHLSRKNFYGWSIRNLIFFICRFERHVSRSIVW